MVVLEKQNILAIGVHCIKAKKLISIIIVSSIPVCNKTCLDKLHCTTSIPTEHFGNLDNDHFTFIKAQRL